MAVTYFYQHMKYLSSLFIINTLDHIDETYFSFLKAREIDHLKSEEACKLEEAKEAQVAARAMVEKEKQKCKAALEVARMAQQIAELESEKRKRVEQNFLHEAEEMKKAQDAFARSAIRYRRYSIDEIEAATNYFSNSKKIGEGGYGPVYKAYLDHTAVAIKVLRSDMSQGQTQFQQEVLFHVFRYR